jgi:predicted dienelactone hydrolase
MMQRRFRLHLAVLMLGTLGASPARASDVPDVLGPWAVGHTEFTAVDTARADRELPLDIWYPVDADDAVGDFTFYSLVGPLGFDSTVARADVPVSSAGPRPLIVFSHGFGGINIQSFRLMEHLASHGFVVVSPEHTGNTQSDGSSPDPEADRYPDVAFVIDEMEVHNATPGDDFAGRIDTQNVGVAGHSFGGMTAQFMAAGHPPFGPDLRVKAIMPVAASSNQLSDQELTGITVPTLLMVGTLDSLQAETIRSFDLISSAFLYRVDVVGANHTHFANVCDIGNTLIDLGVSIDQWPSIGAGALVPIYADTCVPPAFPIEEATRLQNLYAAALFRRHLLGERYYDNFLTGAYAAAREPDTDFFGGGTPVLDHFMCYTARTTKKTDKFAATSATLADALESGDVTLKKTTALCLPADKNGEGVTDDCTHLKAYQLKGPKHAKQAGITVTDQFGTLSLDTTKADRLLVPAAKQLGGVPHEPGDSLDHFKCYRVKTTKGTPRFAKNTRADVVDQFESRTYDLKRPSRLCVPADKNGEGIVNGADHLLCYRAKRAKGEPKHAKRKGTIHTRDQFGDEQLDSKAEEELCVPATVGS